jgi:hypothetical protein
LKERTGWSPTESKKLVSDHPVCGIKVGFAEIFLMPQPPLLTRRGINLLNVRAQFIHTFEAPGEGRPALIRPSGHLLPGVNQR